MVPSHPAVVVTGASSGIGYASSVRLDRAGFQVFAGVRKEAAGAALKAQSSNRLTPIVLDVTDPTTIARAQAVVAAATGAAGLQGLVNNAGMVLPAPIELLPIDGLRQVLEVQVVGTVATTQAFIPLLRLGKGRIVNISSISGRVAGLPLNGSYHAAKFALEGLTDTLRTELRPSQIAVALVEPGAIATPLWDKSLAALDELASRIPTDVANLYHPFIRVMRTLMLTSRTTGLPADAVAQAVEHALTAKRPKIRYLVGRDAHLFNLLRGLPDRLYDWVLLQLLARLSAQAAGGQQADQAGSQFKVQD
jgi:NAD(P)-dependent dehydrogenase (short-subunit alcohol dehydrogenase family)